MDLTEQKLMQQLARAEKEGRQTDAERIRLLLAELRDESLPGEEEFDTYVVHENEDLFSITEEQLGNLEYLPDFLAANPTMTEVKPGQEVRLPKVSPETEPLDTLEDPTQLVELFETKGAPGPNWTAEELAFLERLQQSAATTVMGLGGGDAQTDAGQDNLPAEYSTVALDDEEYTPEEMAEAQAVLDALMELGMPAPEEWTVNRQIGGDLGQDPPPTPTLESESDLQRVEEGPYLSWEDRKRQEQREALQARGITVEATPRPAQLPPPQIFQTTATPTPRQTLDYVVQSGDTLLGLVLEYGVSLDHLAQANDMIGTDLQVGQVLIIPLEHANDFRPTTSIQEQIKEFEGFVPNPENDPAGYCSVGYGHLIHDGPCDNRPEEQGFQNLSLERADELFASDLLVAEEAVKAYVNVKLNQNQFDALISFVYNIGTGWFIVSEVLSNLNQGNYQKAADALLLYDRALVQDEYATLPGLTERRELERALFLGGQDE